MVKWIGQQQSFQTVNGRLIFKYKFIFTFWKGLFVKSITDNLSNAERSSGILVS
jgi:hypothetical protein